MKNLVGLGKKLARIPVGGVEKQRAQAMATQAQFLLGWQSSCVQAQPVYSAPSAWRTEAYAAAITTAFEIQDSLCPSS